MVVLKKMAATRNNHYVPQWYQRGFFSGATNKLHLLDLKPDQKTLVDGRVITMNDHYVKPTSTCFCERDLYTTFFGHFINDEVERKLFGELDDAGSRAVRAFIGADLSEQHQHFINFFEYVDAQKIRTPKGLDWVKKHYPELGQIDLMLEMQALRKRHCTIWTEGVREIVSAKKSTTKFILSDHPVSIYNYALPPNNESCSYPDDPDVALKGSQTIFPLDQEHCLILTNYEYANDPKNADPCEKRTHARNFGNSMVRTDAIIRTRELNEDDVKKINFIIKARARRYIAASKREWLHPEKDTDHNWSDLKEPLLPPKHELSGFGGEMFAKFEDGTVHYQDAFGRTTPENKYLKKNVKTTKLHPNKPCGCGSGKKYKKCCKNRSLAERPSWSELSIRERNLMLCNGINDILGFNEEKTWDDVRRELSNEQIKRIYELYGFLWPKDTDFISLLPKPDRTLRALYTGIIDPRVITEFAVSSSPYFEEILIQHPFVNPNNVKPDFSPTKNPHMYKLQTLKHILLLLTLEPFIRDGSVNFIPDPCTFDQSLQWQMFDMAKERRDLFNLEAKEEERLKKLQFEDFRRTRQYTSLDQTKSEIQKFDPSLSEAQVIAILEHMEEQKRDDPYFLLQDDLFTQEGGQLMTFCFAPNFEISLFLAQITGSILLTDSQFRWNEITKAQHRINGLVHTDWNATRQQLNANAYRLNMNPETTLQYRYSKNMYQLRKVLGQMYGAIQQGQGKHDLEDEKKFIASFSSAHDDSQKDFEMKDQYCFDAKLSWIIPKGGITHNNVQRLLLSTGNQNYLRNVPMAVFVERIDN